MKRAFPGLYQSFQPAATTCKVVVSSPESFHDRRRQDSKAALLLAVAAPVLLGPFCLFGSARGISDRDVCGVGVVALFQGLVGSDLLCANFSSLVERTAFLSLKKARGSYSLPPAVVDRDGIQV